MSAHLTLPGHQTHSPQRNRRATAVELSILRSFELRRGKQQVPLPMSAQRLVAFLALHGRPLQRSFVAGTLWLDSSEARASANLRSVLWRLRQPGVGIVEQRTDRLSLATSVRVDLWETASLAERILHDGDLPDSFERLRDALCADLLPDWYEEWVFVERERFRQLRMHTLETLCRRFAEDGRWAEAIDAGLVSVAVEPLRETGQRALIAAHLAEGNLHEALRQYRAYRELLKLELGVGPSQEMEDLIASAQAPGRPNNL